MEGFWGKKRTRDRGSRALCHALRSLANAPDAAARACRTTTTHKQVHGRWKPACSTRNCVRHHISGCHTGQLSVQFSHPL